MSRVATIAQIEASITNGRRSLGPVSPQGRLVASRNSTKHGLTGAGKCLPPDMEIELASEFDIFASIYHPRDDYERDLIRKAALGNLRSRRLNAASNAHADERKRNATRLWDEDREAEVAALADLLDAEPAEAVRLLTRLAEGCDYLGDAWDALGQVLAQFGDWDDSESRRALRLLGVTEPPTSDDSGPLADFWDCVLALRPERVPDPVPRELPDPAEARDLLQRFVRDQVVLYERLGRDVWQRYDEPSRKSAATRAAFDAGPDTARLQRYIKDADRMRDRSLDELARLRRDERLGRLPAPARNEPERPAPSPARPPTIEHRPSPVPPPAQNEPEPAVVTPARSTNPVGLLEFATFRPGSRPTIGDLERATPGESPLPLAIGRLR